MHVLELVMFFSGLKMFHSPWKSTQALCWQGPVGRAVTSGLLAQGLIWSYEGCHCTKENSVPLVPSSIFTEERFTDVRKSEWGRNEVWEEERNKLVFVQKSSGEGPWGKLSHTLNWTFNEHLLCVRLCHPPGRGEWGTPGLGQLQPPPRKVSTTLPMLLHGLGTGGSWGYRFPMMPQPPVSGPVKASPGAAMPHRALSLHLSLPCRVLNSVYLQSFSYHCLLALLCHPHYYPVRPRDSIWLGKGTADGRQGRES